LYNRWNSEEGRSYLVIQIEYFVIKPGKVDLAWDNIASFENYSSSEEPEGPA